MSATVRAIAFYLPQFHPIPENDAWWGKGFTEWTNVTRAGPRFPGHYQPHLPADLGFYDLRLPAARAAQAALAREYGLHGFCYYHYWFNGKRVLERPFNEVLAAGEPDFPFCLCWANENWTRVWDGGNDQVLLHQHYSAADDARHIESLIPAFRDERYIRINDKPLFLVYRTRLLPDPVRTAEVWRTAARKAGIADLFLVRVESFLDLTDPTSIGFDAAVEFAPFNGLRNQLFRGRKYRYLAQAGLFPKQLLRHRCFDYQDVADNAVRRQPTGYKRFYCASPGWDNSARRQDNGMVLLDSTPEKYEVWLRQVAARTAERWQGEGRICFINAWNEWAEGNHLEPDLRWKLGYLAATRRALQSYEHQAVPAAAYAEDEHAFQAGNVFQRIAQVARDRAFTRTDLHFIKSQVREILRLR